ncbi:TIGR03826 family flagellar region protein [Virgibacillus sp. W0430]|uniref:TIGR03826 family flagellar region protein n=1 Tax=Virgibacillus sp. W0430 TaxID=3391580 RepID=UPI003F46A2FB
MVELGNCTRCDAVFAKSIRDICQACYQEEEEAFKVVYRFLSKQKNREATIQEIVEHTSVDEDLIIKFIKEKRLRSSQFPNLFYPCEKCGASIVEGRLCHDCSESLLKELHIQEQLEERSEQRKQKEQDHAAIYYTLDKHKLNKR